MVDLIQKKKLGKALDPAEINFIIQGYTRGEIPDYQISCFLMAVYFQGMNKEEIAELTLAIVNSGETVDLSEVQGIKVDKHSTGGVGDKVSLMVIPLVASAGVPVAKMSGRGLGHTGGTIDKLESIRGFKTDLSRREFINNVNQYKMAIVGQSENLTPADKMLYALRDVTATVDNIPLIASSIMSKKIAAGAEAILLDVKVGSGAFVKTLAEARELAQTMVDIGKSLNRRTVAIITDMSQPLGREVGNANEVREAIEALQGRGEPDLTTVALTVAAHMTVLGGAYANFDEAYAALEQKLQNGEALAKLKQLIAIQQGDPELIEHPEQLPQAKYHLEVKAEAAGYVSAINAEAIGVAAMLLGAGRKQKQDPIDYAAGLTLVKKVGDPVLPHESLCILHTNLEDSAPAAAMAREAYSIEPQKPEPLPYIYELVE
jgi:pyrimidine-nucleoside phosphorylase/thymidine phosphorylase